MAISFNYIPSNMRVPLFYAEVDNSMANTATADKKSLLIGQATADGTAKAGSPVLISSATQAKNKFGRGSQLALMCEAYLNNDPSGTLWALPMEVKGVAAKGTVAFKGTATESGTVAFYVGGTKVPVSVATGDTAKVVADAFAEEINGDRDLPLTATVQSSESETNVSVALTVKQVGTYGNDIPLNTNLQGATGGEADVIGLDVAITAMKGGTGDINFTNAFACVETETFYYVGAPGNDATALDAYKLEFNDSTGRWSYARMQYGHVFTAKRGTAEELVTFGNTRNDQHVTVFGLEPENPEATWILLAAALGRCAVFLTNDPARPVQTGALNGLMATAIESRFGFTDRNNLLKNGIATLYVNVGTVRIERAITTYQVNSWGDADNSYLDCETLFTLAEIITRLKSVVTSKYSRHKLADDGTNFGPGQAIVTPNIIRSELIAQYSTMETLGLVENAKLFAKYLIVERNTDDVNRVDVLLPPDLVNQLRIFALQAQFRLQFSSND